LFEDLIKEISGRKEVPIAFLSEQVMEFLRTLETFYDLEASGHELPVAILQTLLPRMKVCIVYET
jgi:hypothetical protein